MLKRFYLEITNACNLDCTFCTNPKGNRFLTLADIDKITDEIKAFTPYIYLHVLGEPLVHPFFEDILNLLDQKGFYLQLVTNGTLLFKYPNLLNHPCVRKCSISIHAYDDAYQKHYFKTIDELINQVKDNQSLELRFYDEKHLNEKAKTYLNYLKANYTLLPTKKKNSYTIAKNVYLYFEEFFRWPSISDPIISKCGTCKGAKDMLAILSNGDVTICCLDALAHNKIGNVFEHSLHEIINGETYQTILKDFANNHLTLELCQKCSYRLRFDGDRHGVNSKQQASLKTSFEND